MERTDNKIVVLRGPERVRRRPAVIFGDDGLEGAVNAFETLLNTLSAEGVNGFSKKMIITQFQDASVGIQDFGRGIFLGSADREDIWKDLFCELYAGSAYADTQVQFHTIFDAPGEDSVANKYVDTSYNELSLCAVQYASAYMEVCVHRDGQESRLYFEKGENIGGLIRKPYTGACDTYIRFKLDPTVFTDAALPTQELVSRAQRLAILVPGIQVHFRKESEGEFEETVFCYPAGIQDYLEERNQGVASCAVYAAQLQGEGQERYNRPKYAAQVRIGVSFSAEPGFVLCYHNKRELTYGGTHVDKLISDIGRYLEWTLERDIKETLLGHLQLVVVSNSTISRWVNGTRRSIENSLIRDLAQDALNAGFRRYAEENKEFLSQLAMR